MKAKEFFKYPVCILSLSLMLLFGSTLSGGIRAESQGGSTAFSTYQGDVLGGSSRQYSSYKMMYGAYQKDGEIIETNSAHYVFNASLTDSIVLGPVYILDSQGLDGSIHVWEGPVNTTIPPLGNIGFYLSSTGVLEANTNYIVVITWDGPQEPITLQGNITRKDSLGRVVGVYALGEL